MAGLVPAIHAAETGPPLNQKGECANFPGTKQWIGVGGRHKAGHDGASLTWIPSPDRARATLVKAGVRL